MPIGLAWKIDLISRFQRETQAKYVYSSDHDVINATFLYGESRYMYIGCIPHSVLGCIPYFIERDDWNDFHRATSSGVTEIYNVDINFKKGTITYDKSE